MKHQLIAADILDQTTGSENPAFIFIRNNGFIKGNNSISTTFLDFMRTVKANGKKALGMVEEIDPLQNPESYLNKVQAAIEKYSQDDDSVLAAFEELFNEQGKIILAAHSQTPLLFMQSVVQQAMYKDESGIAIDKPDKNALHVDVTQLRNGEVIMQVTIDEYPIFDIEKGREKPLGKIVGPVTGTFKLKQDDKGVWGYQLQKIETDNDDIAKMFMGEMLRGNELKYKYTNASRIVKPGFDKTLADLKLATETLLNNLHVDLQPLITKKNIFQNEVHEILENLLFMRQKEFEKMQHNNASQEELLTFIRQKINPIVETKQNIDDAPRSEKINVIIDEFNKPAMQTLLPAKVLKDVNDQRNVQEKLLLKQQQRFVAQKLIGALNNEKYYDQTELLDLFEKSRSTFNNNNDKTERNFQKVLANTLSQPTNAGTPSFWGSIFHNNGTNNQNKTTQQANISKSNNNNDNNAAPIAKEEPKKKSEF